MCSGIPEVYHQGLLTDDSVGRLLGMPAGTANPIRHRQRARGPRSAWWVCSRLVIMTPPALDHPTAGLSRGETCLVFYHAEPGSADREDWTAGGHTIVCPAVPLKISDDYTSSEMTFRDPDGVMINCIEKGPGHGLERSRQFGVSQMTPTHPFHHPHHRLRYPGSFCSPDQGPDSGALWHRPDYRSEPRDSALRPGQRRGSGGACVIRSSRPAHCISAWWIRAWARSGRCCSPRVPTSTFLGPDNGLFAPLIGAVDQPHPAAHQSRPSSSNWAASPSAIPSTGAT